MTKCILPFTIDVEMRAYQNKAFPLGVFKANLPDYEAWLCNRLINSIYRSNGRVDSYHEGIWSVKEGLTNMQSLQLKTGTYRNSGIDIVTFNKEMLKENVYITGSCNEFHIKGKKAYQKFYLNRDYILFGYDDDKKVFKSAGYIADGSYAYYDIDYNDYYESIMGRKEERTHIEYYQINNAYSNEVDIVSVLQQMRNYLESKVESISLDPAAECYGVAVWDKIIEDIERLGEKPINNRAGRFYMEHRGVMGKRIQKLNQLGYLKDTELVEKYYERVYVPAQTIHYKFIKYNMTKDRKIINQVIETMKVINDVEIRLLESVIQNIGK